MEIRKSNVKKWVSLTLAAALVFGAGFWAGHVLPLQASQPQGLDFSLFWNAYDQLRQNFIDPSKISNQQVMYGAIAGMTQSLGDPYTEFFDPQQAKEFQQDLSGSFGGIGVEVGLKNGQITVIAPLKGTPGDKAGLRAGDVIEKVDGKDTSAMSLDQAVALIRGNKGTTVILTIARTSWNQLRDVPIVRDTITVNPVEWKLNGDAAVIQIHQFDDTLPADFAAVANQILQSKAKRIVLDLRDDPGGYLEACQQVAGWFLQPGQTVTVEDFGQRKKQDTYPAQGNAKLAKYPLVVLINKGSASATEILAGALRDNRGTKLVGEQSFGKGSVQEVVNLQDGQSFLKVTVAHWLTPNGSSINEVGLKPDVPVAVSDSDIAAGRDPQLQKALQLVSLLPSP